MLTFVLTATQIALALLFAIKLFTAGSSLGSLVGLFAFALFATLAFRNVVKLIKRYEAEDSKPVTYTLPEKVEPSFTQPVAPPAPAPSFSNSAFKADYSDPRLTAAATYAPLPPAAPVQYQGPLSQYPIATPQPIQQVAPAPVHTRTTTSDVNEAIAGAMVGGVAGLAIGSVLAAGHHKDHSREHREHLEDSTMLSPIEGADLDALYPGEQLHVEHEPSNVGHYLPSDQSNFLPPVTADEAEALAPFERHPTPEPEPAYVAPSYDPPAYDPPSTDYGSSSDYSSSSTDF